jgi:hypothetical protein
MSENPALHLIAVRDESRAARWQRRSEGNACEAGLFSEAAEWKDSELEIKWNAEERAFAVAFHGVGAVQMTPKGMLSKRVPLEIARSSQCECGGPLALGDYRIVATSSDFRFEGEFFCPRCKSRRSAETSGFRGILEKWAFGLKKIEIKADGVGIERE